MRPIQGHAASMRPGSLVERKENLACNTHPRARMVHEFNAPHVRRGACRKVWKRGWKGLDGVGPSKGTQPENRANPPVSWSVDKLCDRPVGGRAGVEQNP